MQSVLVKRIRLTMETKGITQHQMAELLAISYPTFNNYINEKRWIDLETLTRICLILDVSADYLLGLSDEPRFFS